MKLLNINNANKEKQNPSLFPVILKRNRTGAFIFYSVLVFITVIWALLRFKTGKMPELLTYGIMVLIFSSAIIFNIVLTKEITYEIDENMIYCRSRFLQNDIIEVKNLVSANYAENGKRLVIGYNKPEFNLKNILEDSGVYNESEGMWFLSINDKDVDKPLTEIKYLIKVLIDRAGSL